MRYPTRWICSVVLSWEHLFRMEIHWLSLVDIWQTYVLSNLYTSSALMIIHILSRLREEHPLVSHRSNVYLGETFLPCHVVLPSSATYKHHAKRD